MTREADLARVIALLRNHGNHATSFQILERGLQWWFDGGDAVVAYVEAAGARVVAGPPVAPAASMADVVRRFVAASGGKRVVFFAVEDDFLEALRRGGVAHDAVTVGVQPEWAPGAWSIDGKERRSLRAQVHRAQNKGVRVRRLSPAEIAAAPLRAEIDWVLHRWLASRRMSVMRFLVDLQPFTLPAERRYYVAERGDRAVGFLAAVPVYGRRGWFFEDVIRVPDAPNGTAEALVHAALADARAAGDAYVTLGMAPLAGIAGGPGPHRLLRTVLRACHRWLGSLYGFEGVRAFKARFRPDRWTPQYVVAVPPPAGLRAFQAVLTAFAGGGLLAFGADTVRRLLERVPAGVWAGGLRALAWLLVPWTLLLARIDGARWFGDVAIQRAWVAFDATLAVALLLLARLVAQRRPAAKALGMLLAGATLGDFLLSTVQALHLHRAVAGWAALGVAVGLCGPLLASLFLGAISITRAEAPP